VKQLNSQFHRRTIVDIIGKSMAQTESAASRPVLSTQFHELVGHMGELWSNGWMDEDAMLSLMAGVKAGCVHLCHVAGNTV